MAFLDLSDVRKNYGQQTVVHKFDLDVQRGEFVSFLGPSGCGKTTTLRMVAGFEIPTAGAIRIDGRDITGLRPNQRNVGMVFQSYALFPNMTVADNVAFGLKIARKPAAEIRARVEEMLRIIKLPQLGERYPYQLSGGQQQRVALARAIVRKPRLFLLDEPLSNLDAKLRLETRVELKKLQRSLDVTAVYVTHDQEEAMTIADRMAVFMEGRIVQIGTPDEVYARPASVEVAAFIGSPPMNLLPAKIHGRSLHAPGHAVTLPRDFGAEREVTLGIRPGALRLGADGMPARVYLVEHLGDSTIVNFQIDDLLLRMRSDKRPALSEGETVRLAFDPADAHLFDSGTGLRL